MEEETHFRDVRSLLYFYDKNSDEDIFRYFTKLWYEDVLNQYKSKYKDDTELILEVRKFLIKPLQYVNSGKYSKTWDEPYNGTYGYIDEYFFEYNNCIELTDKTWKHMKKNILGL